MAFQVRQAHDAMALDQLHSKVALGGSADLAMYQTVGKCR